MCNNTASKAVEPVEIPVVSPIHIPVSKPVIYTPMWAALLSIMVIAAMAFGFTPVR